MVAYKQNQTRLYKFKNNLPKGLREKFIMNESITAAFPATNNLEDIFFLQFQRHLSFLFYYLQHEFVFFLKKKHSVLLYYGGITNFTPIRKTEMFCLPPKHSENRYNNDDNKEK